MEKIVIFKVVKSMLEKINWFVWLVLVILWNYGFPQATPIQDVIVAVILSILFIIIKMFQLRILSKHFDRNDWS